MNSSNPKLKRSLGLKALMATGICSMLGASINVVPFMIHRSVPGIDSYVLPAFIFAMLPAFLLHWRMEYFHQLCLELAVAISTLAEV